MVEAVAHVVRGKVVRRVKVDAQQVADSVVVLVAIEAADGDPARIALAAAVAGRQSGVDPGQQALLLIGSGL